MSYRFCFYAFKAAPWVLGWGLLLNLWLHHGQPRSYTSTVETIWIVLFGIAVVAGLPFGIRIQRGSQMLLCPFCSRLGVADIDRSEGLKMDCPACGEIRGGGVLGWTIVREDEVSAEERKRPAPTRKMQFQSPWFWLLFGVSVVSAITGVIMHEFSFMTVFAPLWCFFVGSLLVQTLQTGRLDDNAGPTFRNRQPVKFWLRTGIWFLAYCFAASLPIAYALQERGETKSESTIEVKR